MTLNERKIELINWITSLKSEEIIRHLESIQSDMGKWKDKIPTEILDLLQLSANQISDSNTDHETVMRKFGKTG